MKKHLLLVGTMFLLAGGPACVAEPESGRAEPQACKTIAVIDRQKRTLTVSGQGQVSAQPDIANLTLGVVVQAKTAKEALAQNSAAMEALLSVLKSNGIEDKDIRTSNFDVQPQTSDAASSAGRSRIVGYRVTNQVVVKVRNIKALGALLDAVVQAGANSIEGISFGFDQADLLQDKARPLAVADARRKAEIYARAAGVTLGPVLSIEDLAGGGAPQPLQFYAARAAVPVAEGEMEMRSSVQIVYGLQ